MFTWIPGRPLSRNLSHNGSPSKRGWCSFVRWRREKKSKKWGINFVKWVEERFRRFATGSLSMGGSSGGISINTYLPVLPPVAIALSHGTMENILNTLNCETTNTRPTLDRLELCVYLNSHLTFSGRSTYLFLRVFGKTTHTYGFFPNIWNVSRIEGRQEKGGRRLYLPLLLMLLFLGILVLLLLLPSLLMITWRGSRTWYSWVVTSILSV